MNGLIDELSTLRLHGMAQAARDLLARKSPLSLSEALRVLIKAEQGDRQIRTVNNRMRSARFPHHKDFAGFDYSVSPVEQARIQELATGDFTTNAENIILVGGAGSGKSHIATALGISDCVPIVL